MKDEEKERATTEWSMQEVVVVVTYLFVVYFQVGDCDHIERLVTKLSTLNLLEEICEGELHNADVLGTSTGRSTAIASTTLTLG